MPFEIATTRRPELSELIKLGEGADRDNYLDLLNCLTAVDRVSLSSIHNSEQPEGSIRNFYRGFEPTWNEILENIPAELLYTKHFIKTLSELSVDQSLVVMCGSAGSGKTTLLMQSALSIHETSGTNSYFLNNPTDNLAALVETLDNANNNRYFLFIDQLDLVADQIANLLSSSPKTKCIIVGAERLHIWESRTKSKLGELTDTQFDLPLINDRDAAAILLKLEMYGPWTRLSKMPEKERINKLVTHARRQLLIGLLETTTGPGFEKIIENDFHSLSNETEKLFVLVIGLATIHRRLMPISIIARALTTLGINENPAALCKRLKGIVYQRYDLLSVRHPVYTRYLFNAIAPTNDIFSAINAVLRAFTVYKSPVLRVVPKPLGIIFKGIINHKFLRDILREDKESVIAIYRNLEKYFQTDGLFWLQYGLALRDFDMQEDAFEKLRTAVDAYPMSHTEHALAQQMIIMALISPSREIAFNHLSNAKETLLRLDSYLSSDDTYPIVTLSEGHTRVAGKFDGLDAGKKVANDYLDAINSRFRSRYKQQRVRDAIERLQRYVITGEWASADDWLPMNY